MLEMVLNSYAISVDLPILRWIKLGISCNIGISVFYYLTDMFDRLAHSKLLLELNPLYTRVYAVLFLYLILPYFVLDLSDKYPTIGVATPSAIWPANNADAAAGVYTTRFKKKNK